MGPELDKLSPILKITFDLRQSCVPSLWHNILQLMVSNTLDRSKIMPKVDSFLAIAEDMLLIKSIKAGAIQSVC